LKIEFRENRARRLKVDFLAAKNTVKTPNDLYPEIYFKLKKKAKF